MLIKQQFGVGLIIGLRLSGWFNQAIKLRRLTQMKKHTEIKERIYSQNRKVRSLLFQQRRQLIRVLYGGKSYTGYGI